MGEYSAQVFNPHLVFRGLTMGLSTFWIKQTFVHQQT
jgi:hypothetical protein